MTADTFSPWLEHLKTEVDRTNHLFPNNLVRGCPIPFFGDVLKARVLTVGVNPSDQEFNVERRWDAITNPRQWQKRLLNYFRIFGIRPWYWFETWSVCLELLGVSYSDRTAGHIDISPRPTRPMLDKDTDKAEFRAMVEHDVKWFFELLDKLPHVQLLLVAGPIPRANGRKQQLADFIREHSAKHLARWSEGNSLPILVTSGHPKGIPVFVCPFDPGVDGLYSMVRQVYRNRVLLRERLACHP